MERDRDHLSVLRGYGILDSPSEPEFDRIVREAAATFGAPIALISLLDEDRQWFKARVGLAASQTPLTIAFCTHAVRGADVFQVENATEDTRFRDNPLVTGDPNIRFYAGAPLRTSDGARIGTLCVIDKRPRERLSERQSQVLAEMADRVMQILEARKRRGQTVRAA